MDIFIGIDAGTSGCRAIAINHDEQLVATVVISHPGSHHQGDAVTQDPEVWWRTLTTCLQQLVQQLPKNTPRAISIAATSGTLLLTDSQGNPLGPALMYNDHQSHAQSQYLKTLGISDHPALETSGSLAKLIWLHSHHGSQAAHALHHADWLAGKLTGHYGYSDENNGLKMGFDALTQCWPPWVLQLPHVGPLLPQVVPPGTPIANVDGTIASALGLTPKTLVIAGTTDSTAAVIASGVKKIGDAVTSLGSTLVCKILSTQPIFSAQYGVYSHRLYQRWICGGASNTGGAVLNHYFDTTTLTTLSQKMDITQPTTLKYYPLLAPGERFPINNPHHPPQMDPRPPQDVIFLQGLFEGIADIEQLAYQRLAELGTSSPTRVFTLGGGAKNTAWQKIREKKLGIPIIISQHSEAAYGSARLAKAGYLGESLW